MPYLSRLQRSIPYTSTEESNPLASNWVTSTWKQAEYDSHPLRQAVSIADLNTDTSIVMKSTLANFRIMKVVGHEISNKLDAVPGKKHEIEPEIYDHVMLDKRVLHMNLPVYGTSFSNVTITTPGTLIRGKLHEPANLSIRCCP